MADHKLVDIDAMKQMTERINQEIKSSGSGGGTVTQSDDTPVMNCEYDESVGKYKLSLNGGSDLLNIKFTTDHPYVVGEYLEIEGIRYDIKPSGGGNLTNGLWKANTIVSGTLDTTNKSFYVDLANRGGGYQVGDIIYEADMKQMVDIRPGIENFAKCDLLVFPSTSSLSNGALARILRMSSGVYYATIERYCYIFDLTSSKKDIKLMINSAQNVITGDGYMGEYMMISSTFRNITSVPGEIITMAKYNNKNMLIVYQYDTNEIIRGMTSLPEGVTSIDGYINCWDDIAYVTATTTLTGTSRQHLIMFNAMTLELMDLPETILVPSAYGGFQILPDGIYTSIRSNSIATISRYDRVTFEIKYTTQFSSSISTTMASMTNQFPEFAVGSTSNSYAYTVYNDNTYRIASTIRGFVIENGKILQPTTNSAWEQYAVSELSNGHDVSNVVYDKSPMPFGMSKIIYFDKDIIVSHLNSQIHVFCNIQKSEILA